MKKHLLLLLTLSSLVVKGYGQAFTSSNLPIMVIDTYSQYIDTAYQEFIVGMGVIDNGPGVRNYLTDPFNNFNGKAEIELHGSSTLWLPKKSYKITTLDFSNQKTDVPLMNLPAEHDWILKGLYQDKTFIRDELAFDIYRKMGHYSVRSRFFELVVNGDYRGVYQLEEKIKRDPNRVDIAKLKATDVSGDELTGGYIIKLDKREWDDEGWYSNYNSNITADSANFFMYEYPKPDSMATVQKDYIRNYFHKFESVLASSYYNSPDSGYSKYLDVPSFIDHFILNEMSRNVDGYRCSTYFYKDQDSKGDGKLRCGPAWDYNIAFDNAYYNGGPSTSAWQYQVYATEYFVPFWWWQFMSDWTFKDELKCRYQSLRASTLSTPVLNAYIDSLALALDESQVRNFNRWPIMGTFVHPNPTPVPTSYAGEISQLKNWLSQRLLWMDSNMPGTCTSGIETLAMDQTIHVFPNPFYNNLHFTYDVPEKCTVSIEVLNIMGEKVITIPESRKAKGNYSEDIHTSELQAGIYLLHIRMNGKDHFTKIIKA